MSKFLLPALLAALLACSTAAQAAGKNHEVSIEGMKFVPERVEVEREEIRVLLKPIANRLGIRLIRVRRLPALDAARRELTAFLTR